MAKLVGSRTFGWLRPLVVLAALACLASACSHGSTPSPTALATGTVVDAGWRAAPTPTPASVVSSPGALLLDWDEWASEGERWGHPARPLDLTTGREISDLAPLLLGKLPLTSVSPDGRLIAVSSYGEDLVAIYDLLAWRPVATIEAAKSLVLQGWSSDNTLVYGWRDYCAAPGPSGVCESGWERELWEIDIQQQSAHRLAAFDFSISVEATATGHYAASAEVVPQGRAYALAIRTDLCRGVDPMGDPFIAAIDLQIGDVTAEIPLPGMLVDQTDTQLGDDRIYAYCKPGIALAPDAARLYVVDSVDDELRVVDLRALSVDR